MSACFHLVRVLSSLFRQRLTSSDSAGSGFVTLTKYIRPQALVGFWIRALILPQACTPHCSVAATLGFNNGHKSPNDQGDGRILSPYQTAKATFGAVNVLLVMIT